MAAAERFVNVDQAACALRVSRATVWRRVRAGSLASIKIGGRRRIPVEAIAAEAEIVVPFGPDNPIFGLIGIGRVADLVGRRTSTVTLGDLSPRAVPIDSSAVPALLDRGGGPDDGQWPNAPH